MGLSYTPHLFFSRLLVSLFAPTVWTFTSWHLPKYLPRKLVTAFHFPPCHFARVRCSKRPTCLDNPRVNNKVLPTVIFITSRVPVFMEIRDKMAQMRNRRICGIQNFFDPFHPHIKTPLPLYTVLTFAPEF